MFKLWILIFAVATTAAPSSWWFANSLRFQRGCLSQFPMSEWHGPQIWDAQNPPKTQESESHPTWVVLHQGSKFFSCWSVLPQTFKVCDILKKHHTSLHMDKPKLSLHPSIAEMASQMTSVQKNTCCQWMGACACKSSDKDSKNSQTFLQLVLEAKLILKTLVASTSLWSHTFKTILLIKSQKTRTSWQPARMGCSPEPANGAGTNCWENE